MDEVMEEVAEVTEVAEVAELIDDSVEFVKYIEDQIEQIDEFRRYEAFDLIKNKIDGTPDLSIAVKEQIRERLQKVYFDFGTPEQFCWFYDHFGFVPKKGSHHSAFRFIDLLDLNFYPDHVRFMIDERNEDFSPYYEDLVTGIFIMWRDNLSNELRNRLAQLIIDYVVPYLSSHQIDYNTKIGIIELILKFENGSMFEALLISSNDENIRLIFKHVCRLDQVDRVKMMYDRYKDKMDFQYLRGIFEECAGGNVSRTLHWLDTQFGFLNNMNQDQKNHRKLFTKLSHSVKDGCEKGDPEVINWMIERGLRMRSIRDLPFRTLCKHGHLVLAKMIHEKFQVNIHAENDDAIRGSSVNGHIHVVEWLFEFGGFPNDLMNNMINSLLKHRNNFAIFSFYYDRGMITEELITQNLDSISRRSYRNENIFRFIVEKFPNFFIFEGEYSSELRYTTPLQKLVNSLVNGEEVDVKELCNLMGIANNGTIMDQSSQCPMCLDEPCDNMISYPCSSDTFQHNICITCFATYYVSKDHDNLCIKCRKPFEINSCKHISAP